MNCMDSRIIWVYDNRLGQSVIEFTQMGNEVPDAVQIKDFFLATGHELEVTEEDIEDGNYRYVISPPLSTRRVRDFGQLCIGGRVNGRRRPPLLDLRSNGIVVIDRRQAALQHGLGTEVVRY